MSVMEPYIFGDAETRAVDQIKRCMAVEEGALGVLCADNHVGYSQPIGGVVAYREHISPTGVGYDIGCGNKAVQTDVMIEDLDIEWTMDQIARRISFGVGRANDEPLDHPVLDKIAEADFSPQRQFYDLAAKQLGTVGSGNHYVDLFVDEQGFVWIGVHFGSRGFGHKTATGFFSLASGGTFEGHAPDGEMDSVPIVLDINTDLGQAYIAAMSLAGEYAYAGRDVVVDKVAEIIGASRYDQVVHNHHNFAWQETHGGEQLWVVRKGATPAFPGQRGFVGSSMGEDSVILAGTKSNEHGLFSTVHGAGRVMSRTQAAGKTRRRWTCMNRDCDWFQPPHTHKPEDGKCPECGTPGLRRRDQQLAAGRVDWELAQREIELDGIVLRGGGADEAPEVYKRLDAVLEAHDGTIEIEHTLTPVGVAMAGANEYDPYKD